MAGVITAVFVAQLVNVQVLRGPALAAEAQNDRTRSSTTLAHRGDITDADGVVLATSVDRYTVAADLQAIARFEPRSGDLVSGEPLEEGGAVGVAKLLAPILDRSAVELAADLVGTSRYLILEKDVTPEVQRQIADLRLSAYVSTTMTSERTYPAGTVAGNLVGFVNDEQTGGEGSRHRTTTCSPARPVRAGARRASADSSSPPAGATSSTRCRAGTSGSRPCATCSGRRRTRSTGP